MNYCTSCGAPIPEGSPVCQNCGAGQRRGGVNNIFSALTRERTSGAIMEFTLWCVTCFVALMALIAAIIGNGNITWIMLMLFSSGMAVLMAFRLKPIAMLYGIGVFYFLLPLIHFVCFSKGVSYWGYYYATVGRSPLNIVLFVLTLLLSLGLIAVGFVFNFTRVRLQNLMTILVLVEGGMLMLLEILLYAAPFIGTGLTATGLIDYNSDIRTFLNYRGYWIGTISMWCMFAVLMLLFCFFFWGSIAKNPERIRDMGHGGMQSGPVMGGGGCMRGISGTYAGRDIQLNGGGITIGSGNDVQLRIADSTVSHRHCAVRYNTATGLYEVQDISTNGVYLDTGARLPRGQFAPVNRGSIICIGSQAQQFRLM